VYPCYLGPSGEPTAIADVDPLNYARSLANGALDRDGVALRPVSRRNTGTGNRSSVSGHGRATRPATGLGLNPSEPNGLGGSTPSPSADGCDMRSAIPPLQ
jgi:hypothetical protein